MLISLGHALMSQSLQICLLLEIGWLSSLGVTRSIDLYFNDTNCFRFLRRKHDHFLHIF